MPRASNRSHGPPATHTFPTTTSSDGSAARDVGRDRGDRATFCVSEGLYDVVCGFALATPRGAPRLGGVDGKGVDVGV